jgi:hypothetical protein
MYRHPHPNVAGQALEMRVHRSRTVDVDDTSIRALARIIVASTRPESGFKCLKGGGNEKRTHWVTDSQS